MLALRYALVLLLGLTGVDHAYRAPARRSIAADAEDDESLESRRCPHR